MGIGKQTGLLHEGREKTAENRITRISSAALSRAARKENILNLLPDLMPLVFCLLGHKTARANLIQLFTVLKE